MNLKRPLAVAVTALSLQACAREPVLSGTYTLKGDVNGPLPVLLERNSGCETKLESGSLAFRSEKKYDSKYHIVMHCPSKADSILPDPGARGGRYDMKGDTVNFFDEADNHVGIAIRRADTLKITGPQHTLIYLQ